MASNATNSQVPQQTATPVEMENLPAPALTLGPSQPESSTTTSQPPPEPQRRESEAIGPSTENPEPKADPTAGPTILITLLLTNGDRHPYKIDARYLRKRNVTVEDNDPYNLTVYTMKELIMRDWREEWEAKPSAPTYIRLIHFGRMLDDKAALKECRFNAASPNVVHMSIKPAESTEEEDFKHTKAPSRNGTQASRSACCGCTIL